MYYYVPPQFELFEFDDESLGLGPQSGRRWFSHWNGLIGKPADEVTLAWSAAGATVLVATSGRDEPAEFARLSAAHLALGGTLLPASVRPGSAEAVNREIKRISATGELWAPGPVLTPGGAPSQVAEGNGFSIAYSDIAGERVLLAAVGVHPDQFSVRKVTGWEAYDLCATTGHTLSELNRALESSHR
jgi:hypothetical protein